MIAILEPLRRWRGFPGRHPRSGDPYAYPYARAAVSQRCG
jgi:hypothetical protein